MKKRTLFLLIILQSTFFAGFAQELQLVLPVGHTGEVFSAQFSPDGKRLFTASYDKTVKIWNAENGILLFTLEGHTKSVRSAQFNLDGKRIVTASADNTAKVWDAENGKLLVTLEGHSDRVYFAQFSPDGKRIVTASKDNTAKVWDEESGKLLFTLEGHTSSVWHAKFSPDGMRIVTASDDNTAKVWDADNGKTLCTLNGHKSYVRFAQFSPDGKIIVTTSHDNTAKEWDAETGILLFTLKGHTKIVQSAQFSQDGKRIVTASDDNTAKVWDADNGILLLNLKGHTDYVVFARFSPDCKRIVTASWDNTAKVWDAESGNFLFNLEGHTSSVWDTQFSPDGKKIVTASYDKTVRIWDAEKGKLCITLEGHTKSVRSAQLSPDCKKIVTTSWDNTVKIWDARNGVLTINLEGHTKDVSSAQFSPDDKKVVTASQDSTAKVWDAENGKILANLIGHSNYVVSAQFSPDCKSIVTASWDNTAKVWDTENGGLLINLEGHSDWVNYAQFSPNGKRIVTSSHDNTAKIWDAETGILLFTLKGHKKNVRSAQFSQDGKSIVTASDDNTAKVWDADNGMLLLNLEGHTDYVVFAQFSPDCKKIVTTSWDNTAKIWDAENGRQINYIHCNGFYLDIDFNNNTIISHNNSMLTLWDMETEKEIYSWIAVDSTDYLVIDPDGHYDGTPGARDYLYFVCGTEIIDLAQMKDALYVPGLIEKIMTGQDINYPKLSELDICGTLPLIERDENEKTNYYYKITPRKLGLEYVEVYVNEKIIYTYNASELPFADGFYSLKMSISDISKHFIAGDANEVNVVGVVKQGNSELRSRGAVIKYQFKEESLTKPKLYAVMIGVNEYRDPTLNLRFPVKDATDFGKSIELSAKLLLGEENVIMYYVHSEVTPETGFTTPEKEGIRKTLEEIGKKANPEDVLLIFFAGHGVMQGEENKEFAFLTADATRSILIGISTKELQNWLSYEGPNKILANKTILIFDACNSGQATQDLMAMARNDDETQKIRQVEDLKDKSGMFILAGSAPNQSAYELPQYEQGLLTYSLLYVLKNNPEILDDGKFLNVQKWFLESEEYLHQLVSSMGYDQDAQPYGTANIRIGEVNEDVKNSIHLAEEKPVLVCSNVLNGDTFVDDLLIKDKINQQLIEISERGTDSQIVFARQETANANKINILYTIKGDEINCQLRLLKNDETIYQAKITGSSKDIEALVEKIIEEVVGNVK